MPVEDGAPFLIFVVFVLLAMSSTGMFLPLLPH